MPQFYSECCIRGSVQCPQLWHNCPVDVNAIIAHARLTWIRLRELKWDSVQNVLWESFWPYRRRHRISCVVDYFFVVVQGPLE